jgi:hypothetical protein
MAGAETTVERLRQFLRELTPQARSLLISELERSLLRGDDAAGADLVLQQLRHIVREQREGAPRQHHDVRLFFKAIEPFLVDDRPDHKHPGRIARASIDALWTWICRDLLPDEAKIFSDDVDAAMRVGDMARADVITHAFQDKVAEAIESAFAAADDKKLLRRVLAQIGTPRAQEDAMALKSALKGRDALAAMATHLPLRIGNLANDQLDDCKALIDGISTSGDELFLSALLIVMNRLAAPWQVVRFGIKAAGSDTAARVADTHYGVTVSIVLAELERLVGELRKDLHGGQGVAVGALLKTIHDGARGLRTELDLPVDSTWGRALAAQRTQIAEMLRSEIESMPGRVRRLLRVVPAKEIQPNSVLDPNEVAETEAVVELVNACRYIASELAISEMTQRALSDLRHYLDSATRTLLDGLRNAGEDDLSFRRSQLDAAVRLSAKVFGKDYAALLAKAAEVAATADRRAAHG